MLLNSLVWALLIKSLAHFCSPTLVDRQWHKRSLVFMLNLENFFYDNHNTGENFNSFLLSQQNDEAAYVPKKFSYWNSFETYIISFLQAFSIDDQEKFDLLAFKNSKYLFYHFNDFIKAYGNPRYKLLHTRKMLNTVGIKKVEEKNKQFLIEK